MVRCKRSKSQWPSLWPFKVTQVKSDGAVGLPMHDFLLLFNSVIHNPAFLLDKKLNYLGFDLSRSFKVKYDSTVGFIIYDLPPVFNTDTWPNFVSLQDTSLQNLSGLDLTFHRSLMIGPKFDQPTPTITPGKFFSKVKSLIAWARGKAGTEVNLLYFLRYLFTATQTDR